MIKLAKDGSRLVLIYRPDRSNDTRWLDDKLEQDGSATLRRTFAFTKADLVPPYEADIDQRIFVLGVSEDGYFRIKKEILGLKHDLRLAQDIQLEARTFIANRDISVFGRIDELINEPIIVGGEIETAIPLADFEQLLKTFPTSMELTHYARSRITRVLKDYFGTISDAEAKLNRYLINKKTLTSHSSVSMVAGFELNKFEYIYEELNEMLATSDSYKEGDWQTKILGLLLFVFPKYIAVLENVHIRDFYSDPSKPSDRYIDLMLVDANGSIDIIELKKPFSNALLSRHKYRDNHTPRRELSGAVMQAEKYIFHLSKWGHAGEQEIYRKRKSELPDGIELKITNPKALILLGRDNDFTEAHRFDFEIIRRKYANMLDIMTYDDLLRRLKNIIVMMKRQVSAGVVK